MSRTELPIDSQLHRFVRRGDFLDCYSVDIGRSNVTIEEIAQRIFLNLPGWINALLAARDLGVTLFGLKTTAGLPKTMTARPLLAAGDSVNFLPVRSVSEDEIILGEDDRHLDFKIAVRRDPVRPGQISLATWVHTHNPLGCAYLRTILPFHVLIVNARLAALARHFA